MTQQKRIHISIAFGDAILPVIDCDDGHKRVPLKPIADEIGVNWRTQTRKLDDGKYQNTRLGIKMMPLRGHQDPVSSEGKAQICVRLDRVTAYLNTINPENIRAQGNHDAADWLEAKHSEWDDALHAYETDGFAAKPGKAATMINVLAKIDSIKNPALKKIAAEQANSEYGLNIDIGKQEKLSL